MTERIGCDGLIGPVRFLLWVTGGCRRQANAAAGLPPSPEIPYALPQLRLVPGAAISGFAQKATRLTTLDWRRMSPSRPVRKLIGAKMRG